MSYDNLALSGQRRSVMEVEPDDGDDLEYKIENFADKYIIQIPKGTYTLTDEILIAGDGKSGNKPTNAFIIRGAGMHDTIIESAASEYGFRFINAPPVFLSDIQGVMPSSNAQSFIFGDDGGGDDPYGLFRGRLSNIKIRGGGSTDNLWCVHLQQPYRYVLNGNWRLEIEGTSTGSGGLLLENPSVSEHTGDGVIGGYWQIYLGNNDNTGMKLLGNATKKMSHLIGHGQIFFTGPVRTGTLGLKFEYAKYCELRAISCEGLANIVEFENSWGCKVSANYLRVNDGGTFFKVLVNCENIDIGPVGMLDKGGNVVTALNDAVVNSIARTITHNWCSYGSGTLNWTVTAQTVRKLMRTTEGLSENSGSAQIDNGTASEVVAHGLLATPNRVFVTGQNSDTASLYVDTIGAVNFTIHAADGNVGGNRDILWFATINQQMY